MIDEINRFYKAEFRDKYLESYNKLFDEVSIL